MSDFIITKDQEDEFDFTKDHPKNEITSNEANKQSSSFYSELLNSWEARIIGSACIAIGANLIQAYLGMNELDNQAQGNLHQEDAGHHHESINSFTQHHHSTCPCCSSSFCEPIA